MKFTRYLKKSRLFFFKYYYITDKMWDFGDFTPTDALATTSLSPQRSTTKCPDFLVSLEKSSTRPFRVFVRSDSEFPKYCGS